MKRTGTKRKQTSDEASIPEKAVTPISRRAFAPVPVAHTSGRTPRTKVNAVIITARKLSMTPTAAAP